MWLDCGVHTALQTTHTQNKENLVITPHLITCSHRKTISQYTNCTPFATEVITISTIITGLDEARVTKFKGRDNKDFELWSLRLSAVLKSKIMGMSLEDKPTRIFYTPKHLQEMMKKVNDRYAEESTANRIVLMMRLLNAMYRG